jgi:uncharacterized OB-fold protein
MVDRKPLPNITAQNAPFWDGLRQHRFMVPQCQSCGDYHWVPYPACKTCQSEDLTWATTSGRATIWSYSVVHRGPAPFNDDVPYVVALAKLSEEPRPCIVMANLIDGDPEAVHIGMPVEIVYEDVPGEDVTVFHFAPVTTAAARES